MRWLTGIFTPPSSDPLKERRGQERLSVHVPVRCRRTGGHLAGTLHELSTEGTRLELTSRLNPGDRIELSPQANWSFRGNPIVTCQVMWCRATATGTFTAGLRSLRSLAGTWLGGRLQGLHQESRRGRVHRRFAVEAPAQLQVSAGPTCAGSLLDLSLGGAQLRVAAAPQPGQLVQLRLPGFTLVASVVGSTQVCEDRSLVNLRFLRAQSALRKLKKWLSRLPCAAAPGLCVA